MKYDGWEVYSLNEICEYSKDRIDMDKVSVENYISTENMFPERGGITSATTLPNAKSVTAYSKGDTLISNIRPYFKKIWCADKEGGASNDVLVIKCDEDKADKQYLYYYLSQNSFFYYVMGTAKGTKMPRGDKDAILKYDIKLPILTEQRAIVNILSSIDAKIQTNNQISEKLQSISQLLFKHWFVDFEFPNEEGLPYKSFGGVMADSELGRIPQGWRVEVLGEVCNIKYGKNLPTSKLIEKGYYVFGGNGVIGYYDDFLYKDPQVLVSCRGAASGKVLTSYPYSFVTNNSLVLELKSELNYEFLKYYCLNNTFEKYATGSAQPQITIENIKFVKILIPSKNVLDEFSLSINYFEKMAFQKINENIILGSIRDTLLPKLMNGEIDLDNIKINQ